MAEPPPLSDLTNIFTGGGVTGGSSGVGIFGAALGLSGIALFVMLLSGGFKYITSGGDPKAAQAAQQTITYALLGLIVIVSSVLILRVIETFTGVRLTDFNIEI